MDIEKQQAAVDALVSASAEESERIEKEVAELRTRLEELSSQRGKLAPEIPESGTRT